MGRLILLGRHMERRVRSEIVVELSHGGMEALTFFIPGKRRRIAPCLASLRRGEGPVHKVADVREDFSRRTRDVRRAIGGEVGTRVANSFAATVGERSECMAKQYAVSRHKADLSSRFSVVSVSQQQATS